MGTIPIKPRPRKTLNEAMDELDILIARLGGSQEDFDEQYTRFLREIHYKPRGYQAKRARYKLPIHNIVGLVFFVMAISFIIITGVFFLLQQNSTPPTPTEQPVPASRTSSDWNF